jgi:hypothetical protein
MFAHDLYHSQIEYFSLRLVDPTARRGMLPILIEKTERSDTTNLQSSIVNIQFRLVRVGLQVNFYHLRSMVNKILPEIQTESSEAGNPPYQIENL